MSASPRILVVGYNAWDVCVPFGGTPQRDSKHEVPFIRSGGGGPGATAAVALARLGARVRLVTRFGDDPPGRAQRAELAAAGVDLAGSDTVPGHASPRAVILVDPGTGERTIFWSRGNLPLLPAAADPDLPVDVDLLYTDGHETQASAALAAVARRRGVPVVMDAGGVRAGSAELVALCSDVISSAVFAPALTGRADPVAALHGLRDRGPQRVAMTFGAGGALALDGDRVRHVPAFAVAIVDTTGAGDAFHAGYAYALATGRDFLAALSYGSAVAALKCRGWGGREALPDRAAVARLLREGTTLPPPPFLAPLVTDG